MRLKGAAVLAWIAAVFVAGALLAMPLVAFAAASSVTIKNFAFTPTPITVHVGDTVTWTNMETATVNHTSTSDTAGLWNTGPLSMGEAGSFTFTVAGTFAYHCAIHASMHGTVIVLAAATPAPTAPPPTPVPTVRTSPPTAAPTPAPSTPQPTASPAPSPSATATPSASATATTVAAAAPSAAAPAPGAATNDAGPGPVLIGVAAVAVAGLAALAFFIVTRR